MTTVTIILIILSTLVMVNAVGGNPLPGLFVRLVKKWKLIKNEVIFSNNYFQAKAFYLREFGHVPSSAYMDDIITGKIIDFINSGQAGIIQSVYETNYYNWKEEGMEFSRIIFILENQLMIDVGTDYAEVLYGVNQYGNVSSLMEFFKTCKAEVKEAAFEINIITLTTSGLELKQLDITPTQLDLELYYNDDFKSVDAVIRERLAKDNDKGIILLHGLPGTGKTTYLRHLVGTLKKKVLFVSPGVAQNLMNPEFLDLLIDNVNAVLIIEDAEHIIMDRKINDSSSVSNLLNLSDGLLSDCLNVQIICTFNSSVQLVDSALTRKGRLIAKYEFGKLATSKAQLLSNHMGFTHIIDRPMTLAEIAHPGEQEIADQRVQVMGFRREPLLAN